MEPIGTPIPQQTPKVINSSMGSVFGTPMQGFSLVNQGAAQVATAVNTPAIMPTDVLTQDVMTLKTEVRDLKNQIEEIKKSISALLAPPSLQPPEPLANPLSGTILDPNPKGVAVIVKKKAGRPKKVLA